MNATDTLTTFCHSISYDQLPSDVVNTAKKLILDCTGVILRSMPSNASQSILQTALALGTNGKAAVLGSSHSLPSQYAALVNGTAAHGIELDDVTSESSLHPGVVVIPTAIAIAEELNSPTSDVIAAIVAGYEMMMRLGEAIMNPAGNYDSGFHPTGICGVFGATITAGKLLNLNLQQQLHAIGIAGSMASGSMEYLTDGAWTKKMHAGWSAHNGIIAAKMAQNDFVGPTTTLDGRFGFLNSYSSVQDPSKLIDNYKQPYKLMETNLKFHACCRYIHAQIDATQELRNNDEFELDHIKSIEATVLTGGAALVAIPIEQKRNPQNIVDAQFSLPFGIACSLVHGKAGYHEFTEKVIDDGQIKSLMQKVRIVADSKIDSEFPKQWGARVIINLHNGKKLQTQIAHPRGGWPGEAATWDDVTTKFIDLTTGLLASTTQTETIRNAKTLEKQKTISNFVKPLTTMAPIV